METSKMFSKIEKIFGLMVVLPPVYMLFRFLKWYIKQEHDPEIIEAEATEA
jgi:hypothetical protein